MHAKNGLFGVETRPRPSRHDEAVVRAAATGLARRLYECRLLDEGDDQRADVIDQLVEALAHHEDGYDIARSLERYGWMPSAEMVEELHANGLSDAESTAVSAWVQEQGIVPALTVGAAVRVKLELWSLPKERRSADGWYDGVVARIDEAHATYTVRIPVLGHVLPGALGMGGYVLPFERVEGDQETA